MRTAQLLPVAISATGILLAAFGGSLTKIQPPGDAVNMGTFTGPFVALIVLLIISAIANSFQLKGLKKIWIIIACCASIGFIYASETYFKYKEAHVVGFPKDNPTYAIVGDSLSTFGRERVNYINQNDPPASHEKILNYSGGLKSINDLWVDVNDVSYQLNIKYLIMLTLLAIAIFSITEGIRTPETPPVAGS